MFVMSDYRDGPEFKVDALNEQDGPLRWIRFRFRHLAQQQIGSVPDTA